MSENFTGYTEGGANTGYLTATASTITGTGLPDNKSDYFYKDFGAAFFSVRVYAEGTFRVTATTGTTAGGFCITFSDTLSPQVGTTNLAGIRILHATGITVQGIKYEATVGTLSGSVSISASTDYFYRAGFLSSLSRYGSILFQVFSDSGRTTLVGGFVYDLTATVSYRYFYPAQSINGAQTDTMSFTNSTVTLFYPAAGIDLTTATLSGLHVTAYADCAVVSTVANNENSYLSYDNGASHYTGNYDLRGVLNVTAFSNGAAQFSVSSLQNVLSSAGTTNAAQGILCTYNGAGGYKVAAREINGGVEYLSTYIDCGAYNTAAFVKLTRDTTVGTYGTIYISVYQDPNFQIKLGVTQSLTLHASVNFQYHLPVQSYNNGNAYTSTFTFGGVSANITSSSPVTGTAVATGVLVGSSTFTTTIAADAVATGVLVGASVASSPVTGTAVATGTLVGQSSVTGVSGDAVATGALVGASTFSGVVTGTAVATGALIGVNAPNTYLALITCRITKSDTSGQEVPVTSFTSSPVVMFFNSITGQALDFSDYTFQSAANAVTLQTPMVARNANLTVGSSAYNALKGIYDYYVQTNNLGVGVNTRYDYYIDATIDSTTTYVNEGYMVFRDGVEQFGGLLAAQDTTLNAIPTAATINKIHQAKKVYNPTDGTVKLYDSGNVLIYTGLAYEDAAGTILFNSNSKAVLNTSWLTAV